MAEVGWTVASEGLTHARRKNPVVIPRLIGRPLSCLLEDITLGDLREALVSPDILAAGHREEGRGTSWSRQ